MLLGKWIMVSLLGLLLSAEPTQPALTYDVLIKDRTIGQMQVATLPTPSGTQYRVDADVRLQFLGERRMVTHFTSTYQNNLLTESSFHDQLNGKTRTDALVRWDGTSYKIRINGSQSQLHNKRVTYSTASLYAREPQGVRELFSERYGQFCALRPVGAHTYELTLPDGHKNQYHYVEGVCREVVVEQALFTLYFRLRPDR
ncbi:DUF6134 family protein [Spirosoma koreense]